MKLIHLLFFLQAVLSSSAGSSFADNAQRSEAGGVPWCGVVADNKYLCVGRHSRVLTVPCGGLSDQQGLSFTYYNQQTQQILLSESTSFLQWYPQWNETDVKICCITNTTSPLSVRDIPCYQMNILYEPRVIPVKWPAGTSKWPILGSPFQLHCPLDSNPSSNYTWTRYQSVHRRVKLNFPSDVIFSSDGKSWKIASFSNAHSGVYECHASNELGEADYRNDALFFLRPDACPHDVIRSSTISLSPRARSHKIGTRVAVTCTVHSTRVHGMKPLWFIMRNATKELCVPPLYDRQHPRWNESSCSWSSELVMTGFGAEQAGEYLCQYGEQEAVARLEVEELKNVVGGRTFVAMVSSAGVLTTVIGVAMVIVTMYRISKPSFSQLREPPRTGFRYDIFISAHDETRELIQRAVLLPLETQCDPPYRICWHLRDFIAGLSIGEQIADAVQQSRKILFVFSEHFSESKFCQLELELAMNRLMATSTCCLLPIVLSEGKVPQQVRGLLTYWPVVSLGEENFLERLKHFIGEPISPGPT